MSNANKAKKDEFYTQLSDIENELRHYKDFFRGKIVFCNCDDPYESNFVKYFAMNFNALGLKKLIATSYATSPVMYSELTLFDDPNMIKSSTPPPPKKYPYKIEITAVRDENGDGAINLDDFEEMLRKKPPELLKGDGDFRSAECIELLKEADVVVTNPPFSLFREYAAQLMYYDKKFIIIGNKNAITYKEFFPLISANKVWVGYTPMSKDLLFDIPKSYSAEMLSTGKQGSKYKVIDGVVKGRSQSIWFTNVDHDKRHEDLILYKHYTPEEYPKYDNYDAIEVSKTSEIPCDYDGVMGVPITFLDRFNPDQFEIVGITKTWHGGASKIYPSQIQVDANNKKSEVSKLNDGPALELASPPLNKTYYIVDNKYYIQLYARVLIRKKV